MDNTGAIRTSLMTGAATHRQYENLLSSRRKVARSNSRTAIVVGGGVGGCCTALKLADIGYNIILLEKGKLFSGSSSRTPGRMGLGFHYVNSETAIMYLKATIEFVRAFPGFRMGEHLPWEHPYRHGRYFIAKDSLFSPEDILATYAEIKFEYARLVAEDPLNEVFGPPETFYRILEPAEYCDDVDMSNVAVGIETAEHLLDFPKFANHLRRKILANKNIVLFEDVEVVDVLKNSRENFKYTLLTKKIDTSGELVSDSVTYFHANYVVNSAWENLDKLNAMAGFSMQSELRTNRVKIICEVELPDALKNRPSMFFCMGPYCMFSNMGNGRGMMTFAPKTNLEYSTEMEVSDYAKRLLAGQATAAEKERFSAEIVAGVSSYIPHMRDAKVLDVKFGVVKTIGEVDIFNCDSPFHLRDYHGVRVEADGWISNPCMKLLYCLENAKIMVELFDQFLDETDAVSVKTEERRTDRMGSMVNIYKNSVTSEKHETKLNSLGTMLKNFEEHVNLNAKKLTVPIVFLSFLVKKLMAEPIISIYENILPVMIY